jgi:hypothetical protein
MVVHSCDPSYLGVRGRRIIVWPGQSKHKTLHKENKLKEKFSSISDKTIMLPEEKRKKIKK